MLSLRLQPRADEPNPNPNRISTQTDGMAAEEKAAKEAAAEEEAAEETTSRKRQKKQRVRGRARLSPPALTYLPWLQRPLTYLWLQAGAGEGRRTWCSPSTSKHVRCPRADHAGHVTTGLRGWMLGPAKKGTRNDRVCSITVTLASRLLRF